MYDRNSVRLSLIHALPAAAEATGVSSVQILSLGGLEADAFHNFDRVVRRSQIHAVMQGLARKSGDSAIGFRIADATDPTMLGVFGRSILVGRTLREVLALQVRHMPSLQRGASISMATTGSKFQWAHRLQGSDPGEARFLNEGIAAFFVRCVRAVSGEAEARLHVTLPHRPMAPLSRYEDALCCAVSFVPDGDLIVRFDAALLDRRNVLCRDAATEPDTGWVNALPVDCDVTDAALLGCLPRMFAVAALMGRLTLRDTARNLGFSPRSLQRRLDQLDTSFEEVVDRWRHRHALDLLGGPQGSTAHVATQLGYADASHFIRAFRRWQGISPTEFRNTVAQEAVEPRA
jgi:AraC-like DNA-binding protein